MPSNFKQELLACAAGICIGAFATTILLPEQPSIKNTHVEDEYHIHTDFIIQTRDTVHELGIAELMTTAEQQLHHDAHLHDEDGDVLHMHEEQISFAEFLTSLGFSLTDECLTSRTGEEFCSNYTESLNLFVNDEVWTDSIMDYVPQDLDRVLLYFGNPEKDTVQTLLDSVADDACIYSGSCPERGTAPPESCGLTCEL